MLDTAKTTATALGELEERFACVSSGGNDIYAHCKKLRELSAQCRVVTEFGTRGGNSTTALLAGQPDVLRCYDKNGVPEWIPDLAERVGVQFVGYRCDVLDIEPIPPTDLLFIDTYHTAEQLSLELERHGGSIGRFLALHDTVTYGRRGEGGGGGLLDALDSWMEYRTWGMVYHSVDCHGLTVVERFD